MNKIQLTEVFFWKYTCFKNMFICFWQLSSFKISMLQHFLLVKSSGLLQQAVKGPFSTCKQIFSIFRGWKRLSSKQTEAEEKIHHAYKKWVYAQIVSKDSFTFYFSWQMIAGLQLFIVSVLLWKCVIWISEL